MADSLSLHPKSGYTLPVFACAAAVGALKYLQTGESLTAVSLDLLIPKQIIEVSIEQVAGLGPGMSLAISRSHPGANLDLTRDTPVWGLVQWADSEQLAAIRIQGGAGIGFNQATGTAAIYRYAQDLLHHNLSQVLRPGEKITVTIILPEGKALASRTSNPAFGIVEGLSLLGTSGISQALSAPEQLEIFRAELAVKAKSASTLVFCIGENGLDLATKAGIPSHLQVKTANWIGPLLVEAGLQGVQSILLWGYHGKLIKLAGGIFHTHHHLADARQEILTAHCAHLGLTGEILNAVFQAPTIEAACELLKDYETKPGSTWLELVFAEITKKIESRAKSYIYDQAGVNVTVGCVLFNRKRELFAWGPQGQKIWDDLHHIR